MALLYCYGLLLLCFSLLITLKMSKIRKIFLFACIIMLIAHIIRYFFYNGDILQTSIGTIAMICLIISVILNKGTEK